MSNHLHFARMLAAAALAGPLTASAIRGRFRRACGRQTPWQRTLARRAADWLKDGPTPPSLDRLTKQIATSATFTRAWRTATMKGGLAIREVLWPEPAMWPGVLKLPVPPLATPEEIARWLNVTRPELDWFADARRQQNSLKLEQLRNYHYRWVTKQPAAKPEGLLRRLLRWGTGQEAPPAPKARLLEIPKARLMAMQRRILREIIALLPPHPACQGFRKGTSILTFAAPHAGQPMILRFDLKNFFPSVPARRVRAIFRSLGYPAEVAHLLAGLCTNQTPDAVRRRRPGYAGQPELWTEFQAFLGPHLPQGAPTSPALANLAAYRLDARLAGLAKRSGLVYTRYADDLAFSGPRRSRLWRVRFAAYAEAIADAEGFRVNREKTKTLLPGGRQELCGVVVNVKPNVGRAEFDRLKAILTNCRRHGPASQDREKLPDFRAHLLGRIAHVRSLNAVKGQRLLAMFLRIAWENG